MMPALDLAERMQVFWPWRTEKPVPGFGAKRHDARQAPFKVTEAHGSQQGGQITTKRPHRGAGLPSGIYRNDEKDCGARKPPNDRLWNSAGRIFQSDSLLKRL